MDLTEFLEITKGLPSEFKIRISNYSEEYTKNMDPGDAECADYSWGEGNFGCIWGTQNSDLTLKEFRNLSSKPGAATVLSVDVEDDFVFRDLEQVFVKENFVILRA